jgi:predicted lipid-binding transport protein (Tim44 family)
MDDPMLIFFAALAAFLSYRLFTVLGTKGGHEPEEQEVARPRNPATDLPLDDEQPMVERGPVPPWAETVRAHYPGFDHRGFVEGAKSAYEMIILAFAQGDFERIRAYVDPQVMKAFEVAVDGRRNAGQTMDVTLVGIERAEVIDARVQSEHVEVTVEFQSDQIRVTRDSEGELVDGDPNRIDLVRDRWTFARPLSSTDPNWTLVATDSAAAAQE